MSESRANRTRENGNWCYHDQNEAEFVFFSEPEYSIEAVDDLIDSGKLQEKTIQVLLGIRWDAFQAYVRKDVGRMMAELRGLHMACRAAGVSVALLPDALRGKKVKASASIGHIHTHGTEEQKAARYAEMTKVCVAIHRDRPKWGKTAIRDEAASKIGVSSKTIARHVDLDAIIKNSK